MDLVEVELSRVVIQQKGDQQYLHLKEKGGTRSFPIVIGFHEVEEINRKLQGVQVPRPLTHDLVGRVIRSLSHGLVRVVVSELRDGTFFANLVLAPASGNGPEVLVDCRPSDAIALAVQTKCRIFVQREVFDAVSTP